MSTDNESWEGAESANQTGKEEEKKFSSDTKRDDEGFVGHARRAYSSNANANGQRSYRPRFNPNRTESDGQNRSYRPRFSNNREGEGSERQQRSYRPYNNGEDGGQQRQYRPRFNSNQDGGSRYYGNSENRQYRPRFNSQDGEGTERTQRSFRPYNNSGEDGGQQRQYRPRFNNNQDNGSRYYGNSEQRQYRPRYNNDQEGEGAERPQRSFRPYNNNGENGGQQRQYRPRFNNSQDGGNRYYGNSEQRQYRPRYNNQEGEGGERPQRSFRPYNNDGGYRRPQQRRTSDYDPNAKYTKRKQIEYKELNVDPDAPIRLNRYLANAGICSRREADEFIQAGVVSVNGTPVTELGTKVKRSDEITFRDQKVSMERKVYVLLNKPKDTVTTTDDPQDRKTVIDLVKDACTERIYPVGRLDRNTTGVLLLTNDGDLASKLTHPKFLKKKVYQVRLDKDLTKEDFDKILAGVELDDGEIHADALSFPDETKLNEVGIEIHSGKNRIVRRIFESLGYKVVRLDRVVFAGLTKKGLRRGQWRYLTQAEVNFLKMGSFE